MKESGIPWIGKIPQHWTVCRLKDYATIQNGHDYKEVRSDNGAYPVIGSGGEFDRATSYLYKGPSVLLGRKGTIDKPRLINEPFWTVDTMYYTIPSRTVSVEYFYYLCTQIDFKFYQYGSAIPSMTQSDLYGVHFPLPSFNEQKSIAQLLIQKSELISTVFKKYHLMIEKLQQYKQSVITEAVTKGLDSNVSMKEVDVDYIQSCPKQWTVIKNKYLLKESIVRTLTGKEEPLSMSQKFGIMPTKEMDAIPHIASSFNNCKIVHVNDLVFNKLKAHLGVFSVSRYEGLVSPDYAVFNSININTRFLEFVFKTPRYIAEFTRRAKGVGAGLTRLYSGDLLDMKVAVPPLDEQKAIVEYLNDISSSVDYSVQYCEIMIKKLQEYQNSLIFEYVTGKKEAA